jgi:hypothetical protein
MKINPRGYRFPRPPFVFYTIYSNPLHYSNRWVTNLKRADDRSHFQNWAVSFRRIWIYRENIHLDLISTPYTHGDGPSYAGELAKVTAEIFDLDFATLFHPHTTSHRHRIAKIKNFDRPDPTPISIVGKTILLIDDLIFTGNTLKLCLQSIQERGGYGFAMAVTA